VGAIYTVRKRFIFLWLILPAPHTLPFTFEKPNSRLEEIASLFSKLENNLKLGQAIQGTNPSFVGELSDA